MPEAPKAKPNAVILHDRKIFWLGTALYAGASLADAITTRNNLNKGDGFIETNPLFGRRPSPAKEAALESLLFIGPIIAFRFTEQSPHKWIRWTGRALMFYQIGDRAHLAHCNAGLGPQSKGCSWL